jgi:hypothetical protein
MTKTAKLIKEEKEQEKERGDKQREKYKEKIQEGNKADNGMVYDRTPQIRYNYI